MNANHQPPAAILESPPAPWIPESEDFARIGVSITERFNLARCRWEVARAIKSGWIEPAPAPADPDPAPGPEEEDTQAPPHPCRTEDGRLNLAAIRRAVQVARSRGWIEGPSQSPKDTERWMTI